MYEAGADNEKFGDEIIAILKGEREAGGGEDPLAEHDRPPRDGWLYHWGLQWEGVHPGDGDDNDDGVEGVHLGEGQC